MPRRLAFILAAASLLLASAAPAHAVVEIDITHRAINFRIVWDNNTVGVYSGSVQDNNKARGTSGDATWNFKKALPCAPA